MASVQSEWTFLLSKQISDRSAYFRMLMRSHGSISDLSATSLGMFWQNMVVNHATSYLNSWIGDIQVQLFTGTCHLLVLAKEIFHLSG